MNVKKRFVLEGRVQGVGCRAQLWRLLKGIRGLSGHVRNLNEGTVELCVEAPENEMARIPLMLRRELVSPVQLEGLREEPWDGVPESGEFRILYD
jgi:acylphosphatase